MDPVSSLGEYEGWPGSTRVESLERVRDAEVLIVNKIRVDEELLSAAPKLRLVCEAATGTDNIDMAAAARHGVAVRNVVAYSTESVVQVTFMHILSLAGDAPRFDTFVKEGSYSRSGLFTEVSAPWMELSGKKIGIVGMGRIGSRVAEVAKAFGMEVSYYSTSGTCHCKDYPSVPLERLLSESDVISIHAPLNAATRGLIGKRELSLMKPTAFLVNMGRGGIVDEAALAEAVDGGVIAGAALDVFTAEPLPADHPFMRMAHPERMRLTPHAAWASKEAMERLLKGIALNIREFTPTL